MVASFPACQRCPGKEIQNVFKTGRCEKCIDIRSENSKNENHSCKFCPRGSYSDIEGSNKCEKLSHR